MVGCYAGNRAVGTPNLDAFATRGIRFEKAYTTCPLCTPARSALFSGQQAVVNGAWANSMSPGTHVPLMGHIFSGLGYRTAYTGKWHLDGTGYFGDGEPGGGFGTECWFDGRNYADFLGKETFEAYRTSIKPEDLRKAGIVLEKTWAHQIANRAISFLENAGNDRPFLLVASFDELHSPYVAPPEYWENESVESIAIRPNFFSSPEGKPVLQQEMRASEITPEQCRKQLRKHYACNRFVDSEIGRILDAVRRRFDDDTLVIYTSDHGDMHYSHGLTGKGPMMYEEVLRVPLIVRLPGGAENEVRPETVSHIDLIPTLLELSGHPSPGILHGRSFAPLLRSGAPETARQAFCASTRFALNHDGWGGFYPIRCLVDGHFKLVINLFDKDEFYDLENDPFEMRNRIAEAGEIRDRMHDQILDEMERIRDPFRGRQWEQRPWRKSARSRPIQRRPRPTVFPFQPAAIEADGHWSVPVS